MSYFPGISLEEVERETILAALRFHRGNRTLTAQDLKISLRTLSDRINQYKKEGRDVAPPPPPFGRAAAFEE